jgi:hypothetical protein
MSALNKQNKQTSFLISLGLKSRPSLIIDNQKPARRSPIMTNGNRKFSKDDVARFKDAAKKYLLENPNTLKANIIAFIESDEETTGNTIIPRCLHSGEQPAKSHLERWIKEVKQDIGVKKKTITEQIVFLALSGKTRAQSLQILKCSMDMINDVYAALGMYSFRTYRKRQISDKRNELVLKAKNEYLDLINKNWESNGIC